MVAHVARFELCGVEGPLCEVVGSTSVQAFIERPPPGVFELSLHAVSRGGSITTLTWDLVVDASAPSFGAVRVSDGVDVTSASYWGLVGDVHCSWDAASDEESGIAQYVVSLVSTSRPTGVCMDGLVEARVVSQDLDCTKTNTSLRAILTHEEKYQCVVQAINGAGMRTTRRSKDFIADYSGFLDVGIGIPFAANAGIMIDDEGVRTAALGGPTAGYMLGDVHAAFSSDLSVQSLHSQLLDEAYGNGTANGTGNATSLSINLPLTQLSTFEISLILQPDENVTNSSSPDFQTVTDTQDENVSAAPCGLSRRRP